MFKQSVLALGVAGMCILSGPATAGASDVAAGHDAWLVPAGNAVHDFSSSPIPADFFQPGSDPFTGQVVFEGSGTGPCGDLLVERKALLSLPLPPSTDVVDIEIVSLSLRSVAPITVTIAGGGGGSTQWDVDVSLSASPQSLGSMTVTQSNASGGTFDSVLPVLPRFTFTQLDPPHNIVALDFGLEGLPALQVVSDPSATWTHDVALPLICPQSTSNFLPRGPFQGPIQPVPVEQEQTAAVPAVPVWGLAAAALLLIVSGALVLARRRAAG